MREYVDLNVGHRISSCRFRRRAGARVRAENSVVIDGVLRKLGCLYVMPDLIGHLAFEVLDYWIPGQAGNDVAAIVFPVKRVYILQMLPFT